MARNRYVNTAFWVDAYVARLSPAEKLAFLYLLTSPQANIAGAYELPLKRAVFDTGLAAKDLAAGLDRFEADGKIVRHGDWVGLVNFAKHQKPNPKVRLGIAKELSIVPREIAARLPLTRAAARIGFDSLSHLNLNLNQNRNPNPKRGLFTGLSPERQRAELRAILGRQADEEAEGW